MGLKGVINLYGSRASTETPGLISFTSVPGSQPYLLQLPSPFVAAHKRHSAEVLWQGLSGRYRVTALLRGGGGGISGCRQAPEARLIDTVNLYRGVV